MTDAGAVAGLGTTRSEAPSAAPVASVVLFGNPNAGKTTLFNALTGADEHVGNYSGVTVDRHVGSLRLGHRRVRVIDVPGTYSLSSRSADEQIALRTLLGLEDDEKPALTVVVVDAGRLERNLYLVIQLLELRAPMVVALNMIDEVADAPPSPEALSRFLGVPCVATNARDGKGIDALREVIARGLSEPERGHVEVRYPDALRADVAWVAEALPEHWRDPPEVDRALALWALTSVDVSDDLLDVPGELRRRAVDCRRRAAGRDLDHEIIGARYALVDDCVRAARTPPRRAQSQVRSPSDRVDAVLLHPLLGFPVFVAIMLVMFQSLFTWADPAIGGIESAVALLQGWLQGVLPDGFVKALVTEGVLGGVGNVVVFLPQVLLLFFFIGLLEDSGYMSRVAYLVDRVMRSLGLHGRAFVPMLSGFACAVPAILATRTMEHRRDRILTMMVVPLMTCSARLPVYTLLIGALFPPTLVLGWMPLQGLLMVGMYLFGTTMAMVAVAVLGRTVVRGRRVPLLLELPPYRLPKVSVTLRMMWSRARTFLTEAGTVILLCSIVVWGLLSYPAPGEADGAAGRTPVEQSYAGQLGKAMEPVIEPLGFDWKIGVGLVGAFAAREAFVSTMGLVNGLDDSATEDLSLRERMRTETRDSGRPAYTPLVGLSLMVFFALACQCMSTLAVVRRETRSWRWPAFLFVYMTSLAWVASFVVYQGGRLLGF